MRNGALGMSIQLFRLMVIGFAGSLIMAPAAQGEHVSNPKASLIDVAARRHELQINHDMRVDLAIATLSSCITLSMIPAPEVPMKPPVNNYIQGTSGPTNPLYAIQIAQYMRFEKRVTAGMNQFLATGSNTEARCAQQQIDTWAQGAALLSYDPYQSLANWYQVEWTISSVAISESVLLSAGDLDQAMVNRDIAWMKKVVQTTVAWDEKKKERNNHHYWRGLAAVAVGVVSSDDSLFSWGVGVFRSAVDDINPAGAFPLEMVRDELAIHYQAFALQPLIPLAEFASRQGVNLYDYRSPSGRTISDAVIFMAKAVADPSIVRPYQKTPQNTDLNSTDFFAACEFYMRRYGATAPAVMKRTLRNPNFATRIGGSTTVLAAPTSTPR